MLPVCVCHCVWARVCVPESVCVCAHCATTPLSELPSLRLPLATVPMHRHSHRLLHNFPTNSSRTHTLTHRDSQRASSIHPARQSGHHLRVQRSQGPSRAGLGQTPNSSTAAAVSWPHRDGPGQAGRG